MKFFRKKQLILGLMIALVSFTACNKEEKKSEEVIRIVKYEEANFGGNALNSKYSGSIKPLTESNISFKVPGNIEKIYVKIGDRVKKGQLLAVIDKKSYILQVKQAEAMYEQVKASTVVGNYQIAEAKTGIVQANTGIVQAKSAIEQAEAAYKRTLAAQVNASQEFERYKNLYLSGNISQSAYDQAKSGLDQAKAGVNQAKAAYDQTVAKQNQTEALLEQSKVGKVASDANLNAVAAQLELAKLQVTYTELRAPAEGVIAQQMFQENENVGAGIPIFRLDSNSQMQAEIYVSETNINTIKLGDTANIYIESLDKTYNGVISEIGSSSTGFGGTYVVKVGISDANAQLKIGMAANVEFNIYTEKEAITLPLTSVNEDSAHKKFVYIVENVENGQGVIVKKEITVGRLIDKRLEILSGLNGHEKVVTAGVSSVNPGEKVKLYEEGK